MNNTPGKSRSTNGKRSIVQFFLIFIVTTTILFLLMTLLILIPKFNQTFDVLAVESDQIIAKVFSEKLEQYIYDRELALRDIANHDVITNVSLLGDAENPAFRDYISHTNLLGENPTLTVLDALGNVLYTEEVSGDDYGWAFDLTNVKSHKVSVIIPSTKDDFFDIAVPILYGQRSEGVLIARIVADPSTLFKINASVKEKWAVSYSKDNKEITSDTSFLTLVKRQQIDVTRYGIRFTYINNHLPVLEKKQTISRYFIMITLLGSMIIFVIVFFLGRKIIIRPFDDLASTQAAIALAVEGISQIDSDGRYTQLNHAYAGTAGYTPDELEGKPWSTTVFPDDLPALNEAYQTMIMEGRVTAEARGIKKDGSLFYKRVTMISQYNDKSVFVGHHCFMQDITASKLIDEKIRHQQRDLQLIFDNVPVKIWYKDDKNKILRLNKKAAESMGGEVEDFEGKDTYDLFPEMAKKYHEDDLEVIHSRIPKLNIVERYTPLGQANQWVSTDKIPYVDPTSNESFLFVCSQDITPQKNAELLKNQLIEKLSHTNQELEQFAYIASHDLKSPLRGIEQLAHWVKEDCADILPEGSNKHLDLMINRVQRMGCLLDDLLSYSRVDRIDLMQESINLHVVFTELLDLHVLPFSFTYDLLIPDENVLIARKPLEIIIRNLLDNAVKHHHKGKGHIIVKYQIKADVHQIEIIDDGPGIAPKMHELAFKMFQTLQARDKVEGSGMGLAIIKKILNRYKGSIEIDSDGSNGTRFKIIWPFNESTLTHSITNNITH